MAEWLIVGVAGFFGVLARYGVVVLIGQTAFPIATLLVNITGSFLAGFLVALVPLGYLNSSLQRWLVIGFLGAYTTMSAFAGQTIDLWDAGRYAYALVNVIGTVLICLGAVIFGRYVAGWLLS